MSQTNRDKQRRLRDAQRVSAPIYRTQQAPVNPRAVASHHQLNNRQVERKNLNPRGTQYRTNTRGGGIDTETVSRYHPRTGIHGERVHEVSFDRTVNQQRGTPFRVPKIPNESSQGAQLRRQRMAVGVGQAMNQVKVGDTITGEFYSHDGQQGRRSSFFGGASNGVLQGNNKGVFEARRLGPDTWQRVSDGRIIKWDPNQAMRGLARLGAGEIVKRFAGGPVTQGLMGLNDLVKMATGKDLKTQHIQHNTPRVQQYTQTTGVNVHPGWGSNTPF